jgi:CTP:molybdopterin cytidylyltransferase MocA
MKQTCSPVKGLAGLVLAAGGSSRLGRAKALLLRQGRPLLCHVVDAVDSVCGAGVTVVTGAEHAAVTQALSGEGANAASVHWVHNQTWQRGMGSSLAAGVQALAGQSPPVAAVLLVLCDQPRVGREQLAALVQLWQSAPAMPAAAAYADTVGAPAVFPRRWFDRLVLLKDDQGARVLLRECPDLQLLDMPEAADDIDRPDDLWLLDA